MSARAQPRIPRNPRLTKRARSLIRSFVATRVAHELASMGVTPATLATWREPRRARAAADSECDSDDSDAHAAHCVATRIANQLTALDARMERTSNDLDEVVALAKVWMDNTDRLLNTTEELTALVRNTRRRHCELVTVVHRLDAALAETNECVEEVRRGIDELDATAVELVQQSNDQAESITHVADRVAACEARLDTE